MYSMKFHSMIPVLCAIFAMGCTVPATPSTPTAAKIPAPTAEVPPSPTPAPTATPFPEAQVVIGIEGAKIQANAAAYLLNDQPSFADSLFHSAVHPGLFRLDPAAGTFEPVLAAAAPGEWNLVNDALESSFDLKPGIKWSDGSALTADDVAFSFSLLKELAELSMGSNRELVNATSITWVAPDRVKFTIYNSEIPAGANQALFTFPILQKKYWEEHTATVLASKEARLLSAFNADLDSLTDQRIQQEREMNNLQQQMSDTRSVINTKQSILGDMLKYIHERKTAPNRHGVKDSEQVVTYLRVIPGLQSEISLLQELLINQAVQWKSDHGEIMGLIDRQQSIKSARAELVESIARAYLCLKLETEPLAIPYRIFASGSDRVDIQAIADPGSRPGQISFRAAEADVLRQLYQQGNLDAIYPVSGGEGLADAQPMSSYVVTGVLINPASEKMVSPVLAQAIACIYSAPDLWQDTALAESINLQVHQPPPPSLPKQPGCSGSLKTRLLNMRMVLSRNIFSWNFLKDGTIISGSMKDPLGTAISPLSLAVDPSVQIPPDVQDRLTKSLRTLGIEVVISPLPGDLIKGNDESVDLLLTRWNTNLPLDQQLCSLSGTAGNFRFPVHMQSGLLETCGLTSAHLSAPDPTVSTPAILTSGKPASPEFIRQSWAILIASVPMSGYWRAETVTAYDLDWLLPLTPSWLTAW